MKTPVAVKAAAVLLCLCVGVWKSSESFTPVTSPSAPRVSDCFPGSTISWRIPPSEEGHCSVPGADDDLCSAGLRGVTCGLTRSAAIPLTYVSAAVRKALIARARHLVIAGDSMGRQAFLRLVGLLRSHSPSWEAERVAISVEHYFHCDATYVVFANGTDLLSIDYTGHCSHSENAQFPVTPWPRSDEASPLLSVRFVWQQIESVGHRIDDAVLQSDFPDLIFIPCYNWSPQSTAAAVDLLRRLRNRTSNIVVGLTRPDIPKTSNTMRSGMSARNRVLTSEATRLKVRIVDTMAANSTSQRCDGVHFMCVLVPSVAVGRPRSLRAPCLRCESPTLVDFWRESLHL